MLRAIGHWLLDKLPLLVLGALAMFFAQRATRHRNKADRLSSQTEVMLLDTIENGDKGEARKAQKALKHIDKARAAEKNAADLLTKGAEKDVTAEAVLHRWDRRRTRSL